MHHRPDHPARAVALAVVLAVAAACSDDASSGARCAARAEQGLLFGSERPGSLALSDSERAAIGTVVPEGEAALCTGVLIMDRWVLTAAHCAISEVLSYRSSAQGALPLPATSRVVHDSLDVMLLEIAQPRGAAAMTPVPLWPDPLDPSWIGREVTLAGVGKTEQGEYGALRFAAEPIVAVNSAEIAIDGMGQTGACDGDSGGPLLVADVAGQAFVAGVLDRGSPNCLGVDVYTRVDRVRSWVIEATGECP